MKEVVKVFVEVFVKDVRNTELLYIIYNISYCIKLHTILYSILYFVYYIILYHIILHHIIFDSITGFGKPGQNLDMLV